MSGARAGISGTEINKGGVGAATVKRYWPGKAPDWVDKDADQARSEDEDEQAADEAEVRTEQDDSAVLARDNAGVSLTEHVAGITHALLYIRRWCGQCSSRQW